MNKTNFKHSGVEWLGQIPKHWEVRKMKFIFKEISIKNRGDMIQLAATQSNGVVPKDTLTYKSVQVLASDLNSFKFVQKNNFVISLRSFEGGIEHSNFDGIISPAYTILKNIIRISYEYFKFLLKSNAFIFNLNQYKTGIREGQNISYIELQNDFLPLPPLNEQRQIAEFLDKKCEKISEFIAKKQRLITLLKEQKQTLINECVCGRLDFVIESERSEVSPSLRDFATQNRGNPQKTTTKGIDCHEVVPTSRNDKIAFKHSGVEWLGQIPKHWEVRKLKQIGVFDKGNNITKKYISYEGLPFIVYGDIYAKYNFKVVDIINKISNENANLATLVKKNTLLFSASGEIVDDIGKCIVLLADFAYIGGDVITLNVKNCDSVFLSYALNSTFAIYQKALMGKGDIIVHIHILNLKNLQIPLPPLNEQRQIAEFLDKKCEKIDKAIRLVEQEINKMKEYKTSLIDKAVKGQINA